MKSHLTIAGINVQYPWSDHIVSGKKTIETRRYPIPAKHVGKDLALIETPGKSGKFKARIVAIVRFAASFEYKTEAYFARDRPYHLVSESDSDFWWTADSPRWGWPIESVYGLRIPILAPTPRGIVFASDCTVPRTSTNQHAGGH